MHYACSIMHFSFWSSGVRLSERKRNVRGVFQESLLPSEEGEEGEG